MKSTIRHCLPDEVGDLAEIERAAGRLFPPERIPDPEDAYPVALLQNACRNGLLYVADAGGTVAGFATCTEVSGRLHLDELSVHPDHGRQGFGRRLVAEVIEAAEARGLSGVSLTTFSDIPWNGPFYTSMGFQTLSEEGLDETLAAALANERQSGLTERIAMFRPVQKEAE